MSTLERELHELVSQHRRKFGETNFTIVGTSREQQRKLVEELRAAVAGKRGPVTDEDIGIKIQEFWIDRRI